MTVARGSLVLLSLAALISPAWCQRRRDPLTLPEIDQLRDTAWEPEQRLKLYVKFARERLTALERVRSDPKVTDRAQAAHDKLQDFLDVYDELNDNIDTYEGRKSDLRKALKPVIEGDMEFQSKLRAFKDSVAAAKEDTKDYEFLLANALEAVDNGAQDHRQLLAEQEEAFKHKRKEKQ
jgi:predicted  nucleic acid-binding Zn-ribbon protein